MATKTCRVCSETKDRDGFPKAGLVCSACLYVEQKARRRRMREAYLLLNPPQPKPVITHKVCSMCGDDNPIENFNFCDKAQNKRAPYCRPCHGKRAYRDFLRRANPDEKLRSRCNRYGTTPEWYKERHAEQDGKCAICGRPESHPVTKGGKVRRLAIDHDHASNRVRGLLCFRCNTALHQLELNGLDWAEKAVAYLEKFKE